MADLNSSDNETLLVFPCHFPLKVMGETHDDFAVEITKVIKIHQPNFDTNLIDMRGSAGGKYISLTCLVHVTSKLQLDNIYRALSSHPMVKVVL